MSSPYAFLKPLLRGLPIIIATTVAGMMAAKKYLLYTTPMFESTAKIKLADIHDGVSNGNLYKDFDVFVNSNKIGAEVELLKSKVLVGKALQKLDITQSIYRVGDIHKTELYNQSPFHIEAAISNEKLYNKPFQILISANQRIEITAPDGEKIYTVFDTAVNCNAGILRFYKNETLLSNRPKLPLSDRYEVVFHSREWLVDNIISGLDVMAVDKDIPVLRISYTSPVPEKAADIVNTISAAYITDYVDEKFRSADTTSDFLNRELKYYGDKLSASENAIETYRDERNIINIRQETETDLRKISDMKKQSASLQMRMIAVDSLNNYIQKGKFKFLELAPNFEAFTDLLSTELVKKTKELQREKQDLLLRYTPENEKVKVVDAKLDDINSYFVESIGNTKKSLHVQYDDLQQTIADAEKAFIGLPTREKTMTILERNFGLNEQIYRFLSEKRTEAEIAKAAKISFHRIISAGEIPTKPVSPNSPIIKILAAILGMMGGVSLIYGVHAFKGRVNNDENISRQSSIPLIAKLPFCKTNVSKQIYFRKLALELELKKMVEAGKVVTVSSFDKKEGKDFVSAGLSEGLSSLGKKIKLIDASVFLKSEMQNPDQWKQQLSRWKAEADVIVVKNFNVSEESEAMMLMATADLNLFLFDSRRTRKKKILEADVLQQELNLPGMFYLLNRAGYNPSLISQLVQPIFKLIRRKGK